MQTILADDGAVVYRVDRAEAKALQVLRLIIPHKSIKKTVWYLALGVLASQIAPALARIRGQVAPGRPAACLTTTKLQRFAYAGRRLQYWDMVGPIAA